VGAAAGRCAAVTGQTGPDAPGAPPPLAWAECRAARGGGGACRAGGGRSHQVCVVHSSQWAQPQVQACAKAHAQEAERVAEHLRRVAAQRCAWAADAEEAIAA